MRSILHLQRTIGNQAVQQMLQTDAGQLEAELTGPASPRFGHDFSRTPIHPPAAGAMQTTLAINKPGDSYEQEADRIAEQVMRTPEPKLQRACPCDGGCPKCHTEQPGPDHERFQIKRIQTSNTEQIAAPPIVHEVLHSPGQSLDPATRAFMEPRFGYDFSRVRVHFGGAAEKSAQDVNAHAYTVGRDIVFGTGHFAPETSEGRRLIAHELTHVAQQSAGNGREVRVQRGPSDHKPPIPDAPILGGSGPTSDVVVLYHYGDLEARGEMDAKTTKGAPFTSTRGYPRLTDCGTATCQAEATRHTGTPQNEKLRHKYEIRIDRDYFEKNFTNTGTRGAYSEFASKQPIPIKYFRRVSSIAPTSSAPPKLPSTSGELTVKTPRPEPPSQRGKVMTQSGSYQEVLSGETVKGEFRHKGGRTSPSGVTPSGSAPAGGGSSGRGGIVGRGGRGSGFGFGAVAMEIMYPEMAKQAKAQAKADEISEKLARYDKEINDRLDKLKPDIAKSQLTKDANERVYMNVVYEVHHFEFSVDVYLKLVEVTTRNLNHQRRYSTVLPEKGWATGNEYKVRREVDEHTYSLEVWVYSEAELEHFADLSEEYLKNKRTLDIRPGDETAAEQLAKVRKEIVDAFGSDNWVLSL